MPAPEAPAYFKGYGAIVARFCEKRIRQTKGRWAGDALKLEQWQRDFLDELFLVDSERNFVYREALLGIPRKNGKSTLCAAIALYALLAMGEAGAEVYAAAASKDQARIVFDQARQFVEASPRLRDWLTVHRNVIVCKATGGIFRVLSSDAPLQHGLNPSCVVIDELWAHKDPELYYALTTGQLARENPLVVSITTAGFDRETICHDVYQRGKELRAQGLTAMRKARFLFRWFEAPDGCDILDPVAQKKANPSSWIKAADLALEANRLPEFIFRRLHLNQWTAVEDAWITEAEWRSCVGKAKIVKTRDSWSMIDVGQMKDSSAVSVAQWEPGEETLHVKTYIMLPEDNPEMGIADSRALVGWLHGTHPGMLEVNFDPWGFRESAEEMAERGVPMVQFDQTHVRMGPASEKLYELVKERRLIHEAVTVKIVRGKFVESNGTAQMERQVLAAVVGATDRGWRLSKRKSRDRIDGTISLAGAAYRAVEAKGEKPVSRRAVF